MSSSRIISFNLAFVIFMCYYPLVEKEVSINSYSMFKGILIFILGQTFAWFSINLQFMSEWWKERPVFTALVFSFPVGLMFLYGTKWIVQDAGYYWASRIIGFSISTIIYSILTWFFLGESFLETKTLICLVLSIIIVCIQVFWR